MSEGSRPQRPPLVCPGQIHCMIPDMTVVAAADVSLDQLQQELAAHRQWLAVDGDPSWTLGRLVSENSTGPLRLGFGGWRDILLGCQFENGRGELISAGAQTMKNVAGYDLTKFMVGQRDIFGKLVTLTARTYRLPDGALSARFPGSPAQSVQRLSSLLTTACRPQWSLMDAHGLTCGYLADQAALDYLRRAINGYEPTDVSEKTLEQDSALRRSVLQQAWEGLGLRFRASLPPAQLASFIALLQPDAWAADPAFGIVWGNCSQPAAKISLSAANEKGTATVFDGDRVVSSPPPAGVDALLLRLKAAFDPDGTLPALPIAQP